VHSPALLSPVLSRGLLTPVLLSPVLSRGLLTAVLLSSAFRPPTQVTHLMHAVAPSSLPF
jgi:hypothetical protein